MGRIRDDERARLTLTYRAALVTASVVLLSGMALRACVSSAPGIAARRPSATGRAASAGPRATLAGMPVGYAHRRAGALAAAVTLIHQGQRIFAFNPDARDAALRAVVAGGAADAWVRQQQHWLAEMDGIAAHSQAPVTWQVGVLATRVDAYTPARARVALWRVGILSTDGFIAPIATYSIVTYELVWAQGDWKVWSETQVPGPTPVLSPNEPPASPQQLRDALDGFTRAPSETS